MCNRSRWRSKPSWPSWACKTRESFRETPGSALLARRLGLHDSHDQATHKPPPSVFNTGGIQGLYRGHTGGKAPAWEGIAWASIPGSRRLAAYGFVQGVLRFVVFRQRGEILGTRLRQVLQGLDVFQHDAHAKLLALAREAQRLGGRRQVALSQADLRPQGLHPGQADDHLRGDG